MKGLPPLNPLRAFEVAGRLRSIRRAGDELAVTAGAVSRQVQTLEAHLGIQLFRREPREIVLTSEGERYLEVISSSLARINEATQLLTGRRGVKLVRIRGYITFSMNWLIPRIGQFQEGNPDIEVQLTASNEKVDFEKENIDAAIRLGDGQWDGMHSEKLVKNLLAPVCSPKLIKQRPLERPSDLDHVTLLHSTVRSDDWRLWAERFADGEINTDNGNKYASSALVYQAAIEGQGVAMAQMALVKNHIAEGRLNKLFDHELDMGDFTYYLIYPKDRLRNPSFRKFKDWLINTVADETD
jgi:LysR family transcriptional regulator, glycine cleavage system transcriptional activator